MYCSRPTCFRKLGISLKFSPFVPCSDCYGFIKGEFASSETYCSVCAGSLFLSIPCMFDTCLAKLYLNADLKLHLVQSHSFALSGLPGFGESSLGLHTLQRNTVLLGCPTISQVWDIQNYFYSWRFRGISDEVFIKIKEKYWKSTVRLTLQLYKGNPKKIRRKNLKSRHWHFKP